MQRKHNILLSLRINKLDLYILRMFIFALFGSLILFIGIYKLVEVFNDMRWIPPGTDFKTLLIRYLNGTPFWILILEPFSFLFATCYVFSKLSGQKEIIAVLSAGVSIYRLSFYVIVFSVLYYLLLTFYIQDRFVYKARQKEQILNKIIFERVDKSVLDRLKDNSDLSLFGDNNLLYVISYYHAIPKQADNITIIQYYPFEEKKSKAKDKKLNYVQRHLIRINFLRNIKLPEGKMVKLRIDAEKMIWNSENKSWTIYNGKIRYVNEDGSLIIHKFDKENFDFIKESPENFERVWYPIDAMTTSESREYVEKLKKAGQFYGGALYMHYSKYTYSLGIIFIVIFGIGLINVSERKSSLVTNLFISLMLFATYYLLYSIGNGLAIKGTLNPLLAANIPPAFLGSISLILFLRVRT